MENKTDVTWYEFLKQRRKSMGLTIFDTAAAINVAYPTISNWEAGRVYEPTFFTFMKLLNFLSIHPEDMFYLWEKEYE